MRLFLGFFLSLIASVGAWGADPRVFYIDYVDGNDNTNGLCTTSAWKHTPESTAATGVADATVLQAGDVLIFKCGVNYGTTIRLLWSGTASNPIIYTATNTWGTVTTRGNMKAQMDRGNLGSTIAIGATTTAINHRVFHNFEMANVGGIDITDPIWDQDCIEGSPDQAPPGITGTTNGTAFYFDDFASTGIKIRNCHIIAIGTWTNASAIGFASPANGDIQGIGVRLFDAKDAEISNTRFEHMQTAISIKADGIGGTSNVLCFSNFFTGQHIQWCHDVAPGASGTTLQNIYIHHNEFLDTSNEYNNDTWNGCFENPHTSNVFLRTSNITCTYTNVFIYNNKSSSDEPDGGGGTAVFFISEGPSARVYNNVILDAGYNGAIELIKNNSFTRQRVDIFNNSQALGANFVRGLGPLASPNRRITFQNNAVYKNQAAAAQAVFYLLSFETTHDPSWTNWPTADYNLCFNPNLTEATAYWWARADPTPPGNVYQTLAQVRSNYECDINGVYDDPDFTFISIANPSTSNLRPLESSPLRGAGTNLTSFAATFPDALVDYDGNPRPAVGQWDIGAFQYVAP